MMDAMIATSTAEARALMGLLDKLLGLPRKGVPLTPGPVTISDTPGVGWRIHATRVVVHPTDGRIALFVTPEVTRAAGDSTSRRRLTPRERSDLDAAVAGAAPLTSDWRETGPEGDVIVRRRRVADV